MRSPLILASLAVLVLAAGCASSRASTPPTTVASVSPTATITGGTAALRARTNRLLAGMGRSAIERVSFARNRVTITVHGRQIRGESRAAVDETNRHLWQASVIERALLTTPNADGFQLRSTAEQLEWNGQVSAYSSGIAGREHLAAPIGAGTLVQRIRSAAARAAFNVKGIRLLHPDRIAATAVLTVPAKNAGFGPRLVAFNSEMAVLDRSVDGLAWQLRDRCGNVVAEYNGGSFVNPRWLCPVPWFIGIAPTAAGCRKWAATFPACG